MNKFLSILLFTLVIACSKAEADHSDNGKCLDEIKHWNSLTSAQQEQADAKAKRNEGTNAWANGDKEACETAYTQAIILATD